MCRSCSPAHKCETQAACTHTADQQDHSHYGCLQAAVQHTSANWHAHTSATRQAGTLRHVVVQAETPDFPLSAANQARTSAQAAVLQKARRLRVQLLQSSAANQARTSAQAARYKRHPQNVQQLQSSAAIKRAHKCELLCCAYTYTPNRPSRSLLV